MVHSLLSIRRAIIAPSYPCHMLRRLDDVDFGECDIRLRRLGLRSNRDWIPNNLTRAREKLGTDVYGSPRTAVYCCWVLWLELPCRLP